MAYFLQESSQKKRITGNGKALMAFTYIVYFFQANTVIMVSSDFGVLPKNADITCMKRLGLTGENWLLLKPTTDLLMKSKPKLYQLSR